MAFLKAAVTRYRQLGIRAGRVMTDNRSRYRPRAFARTYAALGVKHIRSKPYTPKTNGKAERPIRSSLREWADGRACQTSEQRKAELPYWHHPCNWHRPDVGKKRPPISRSGWS